MSDERCPRCGYERPAPCPPEPPIGTWVKDRHGASFMRINDRGWGAGPNGYPGAQWSSMWEARGPLVECGPWGAEPMAVESP
jgi:hypothetical protein